MFCCSTILTLGFYYNFWNASNQEWFNHFQYDSESLVVGRLAVAERNGIFSKGGLMGRYHKISRIKDNNLYQYEVYANHLEVEKEHFFDTYNSQTGGQALTFVLIDRISPFSNITNIKIFKLLTSILTAFVFSLILLWFFENLGLGTALITLILILFSQWITVFGRNLYWSLWSFYIPFITILTALSIENKNNFLSLRNLFSLVFLSVFVKCFYSGFEYITTTLIMLVTPFIYYAIVDSWGFKKLFKRIILTAFSSICAIILSFLILIYQISCVKGNLLKGFEHIVEVFLKRTYGNPNDPSELIRNSLESRIPEVLEKYWNGIAFDFNNIFINSSRETLLKIDFGELILSFAIFSGLSLILLKYSTTTANNSKRNIALIATCWVSILAPLSWFILFKSHSYIHTHMNYIVWYMPFALFGYALVGNSILSLPKVIYRFYKTLNLFGSKEH